MLKMTITDVDKVTESLRDISKATKQINKAMDSSTKDAEKLNYMTQIYMLMQCKAQKVQKKYRKLMKSLVRSQEI